jgi:hypothetical protein
MRSAPLFEAYLHENAVKTATTLTALTLTTKPPPTSNLLRTWEEVVALGMQNDLLDAGSTATAQHQQLLDRICELNCTEELPCDVVNSFVVRCAQTLLFTSTLLTRCVLFLVAQKLH